MASYVSCRAMPLRATMGFEIMLSNRLAIPGA
jgi:hypothetical protein